MSPIRLLLAKDFRLIARSPLLLVLLVAYPLMLALLVGIVVSGQGVQPRVAFVNADNIPDTVRFGSRSFDFANVIKGASRSVDLVRMSQAQADRALERGDVVAAIVVPKGFLAQLRSLVVTPEVELQLNRNALEDRIRREAQALVYNLNSELQTEYVRSNADYLDVLVRGGTAHFLGRDYEVLGLNAASSIVDDYAARLPAGSSERTRLESISHFANQARLALAEAHSALEATAHPILLKEEVRGGRSFLLGSQVQGFGLAVSLTFMGVLLAAGAIALEREENVLGRFARGLATPGQLLAEKIALSAIAGIVLGVLLWAAFGVAVAVGSSGGQPWLRLPLLLPTLAASGAAVGAFGVLLGVLARDLRTASIAGLAISLPFVLLGIVPPETLPLAAAISAGFPFAPSAHAFATVLFDSAPLAGLLTGLAHLLLLTFVFAALARWRFARLEG